MAPPPVILPTLHVGQMRADWMAEKNRRLAVRCGRRFGKSTLGITRAMRRQIKKQYFGWFTPDVKTRDEVYDELVYRLEPIIVRASSTKGIIKCRGGGGIDFWTLDNKRAGRSRKYHEVFIDEAGFTDDETMMEQWEQSIEPTLLDYCGNVIAASNTNGVKKKNFLWRICKEPEHGFVEYHAPTSQNPLMSPAELAALQSRKHPLVWMQEYEAEFVDFGGVQFFERDKMLVFDRDVRGTGCDYPTGCDYVFAVIDSASKMGKERDSTAVSYWARDRFGKYPLILLDWDIKQIEGSLLIEWIPAVYRRLEELSRMCRARQGSRGTYTEDKDSGVILNQQLARANYPNTPIAGDLTAKGKDGRAIAVSDFIYRGEVKVSQFAHEKTIVHKERSSNHWEEQVFEFKIGDPDAERRADDLLDTCTYGIYLALGDSQGLAA